MICPGIYMFVHVPNHILSYALCYQSIGTSSYVKMEALGIAMGTVSAVLAIAVLVCVAAAVAAVVIVRRKQFKTKSEHG